MRRWIAFFAFSGLLLTAPLSADEFRLTDGRVIVGKVQAEGETIEVATRDGVVSFSSSEVVARRTQAELFAELRKLEKMGGDSANHKLQLAKTALAFGLTGRMWHHLDGCLERLPADRAGSTGERCRRFLATLEPEVLPAKYRDGSTKDRVRALARQVRRGSKLAKREAVVELLAHEPDAADALRFATRRETVPERRLVAIAALLRRDDASPQREANDAAVYRSLILDKERDVRVGTAELVQAQGAASHAMKYLSPGFLHDHPSIRGRTAQAFANLGDISGAPYLVAAGPLAGVPRAGSGGYDGVRAHMFQITNRTYIQDFEVEIAQAAAVANPIIGTAQSGVVLDVVVGGVVTMQGSIEKAYRRALKKIVGADPGPDPSQWAAWWRARQPATNPAGQ